jgi:hypothetical protein
MAVITDIIEGHSGRYTFDGWQLERIFVVSGVTGTGHARLENALNTSGVPELGDAHPTSTGSYLREAIPSADDSDTVRIRCIYATPGWESSRQELGTVEVNANLSQTETNVDRLGLDITTGYTYPADYAYSEKLRSTYVEQGGMLSKLVPDLSITKSQVEYLDPQPKAKEYVGTVNNGPWSLAPSDASGTWLCTGIVGRSNDGGTTWLVTYSFQYRGDTWTSTAVFIDPHTGKPPADLGAMGVVDYELYDLKNFNNLGL